MKKLIALSAVLVVGSLGMACGDGATNNAGNKPANTTTNTAPAAVNTAPATNSAPATSSNATTSNMASNNSAARMAPANGNMANANKK